LGWLFKGIYNHDELAPVWTFKGGTCLKKCYFETYRFSEDLDFTLSHAAHLNDDRPGSRIFYSYLGPQLSSNRMMVHHTDLCRMAGAAF
jgi:predicted nucleotidyltransferase component of viral defense system